jgi:hypothetical protein
MTDVHGEASTTLTDDDLGEPGVIGPTEVPLCGRWAPVEDALGDLPHGPVLYRWRDDSTGELALFVEVPLTTRDVPFERLSEYRSSVRDAIAGKTERGAYVHFVGPDNGADKADA